MKLFEKNHAYEHPWEDVTKAVFSKYPNPISTHVLATDVIEQRLLPDNTLLTRRLILKASKVPRWARYLVPLPHGYVVETSRVDLANKIMTLETVNLSYVRLMKTREVQTMQPCHSNPDFVTHVSTVASFESNLRGLKESIETFGYNKFHENFSKSRQAILYILMKIKGGSAKSSASSSMDVIRQID